MKIITTLFLYTIKRAFDFLKYLFIIILKYKLIFDRLGTSKPKLK